MSQSQPCPRRTASVGQGSGGSMAPLLLLLPVPPPPPTPPKSCEVLLRHIIINTMSQTLTQDFELKFKFIFDHSRKCRVCSHIEAGENVKTRGRKIYFSRSRPRAGCGAAHVAPPLLGSLPSLLYRHERWDTWPPLCRGLPSHRTENQR